MKKKPYERIIDIDELYCPVYKGRDVELFNPESQRCVRCGSGSYEEVKWFE